MAFALTNASLSSRHNLDSDAVISMNRVEISFTSFLQGLLLINLASVVPDGMVVFFPSYLYLEQTICRWQEDGILERLLTHKLLFIETKVSMAMNLNTFLWCMDNTFGCNRIPYLILGRRRDDASIG